MKKIFSLIIAISIVSFSLTGCVNINIDEDGIAIVPQEQESQVEDEESTGEMASMVNPWSEVTIEELSDYNVYFQLPDGAEDIVYLWNDSLNMGEADFSFEGMNYTYRIGYTKMLQDISGLNYEWTIDEPRAVHECEGRSMKYIGEDEQVEACLWYDEVWSRTNCISVLSDDLEGFDIQAIVDRVYNQQTAEDCVMEYLNAPYWSVNYDARTIYAYTMDDGTAGFSFYNPLYEVAGSNVALISIRENTTCEDVLAEFKRTSNEPEAESVFNYFGADGVDSYTYIPTLEELPEDVSASGLAAKLIYIAIPWQDDVILIDLFMTVEPEEEMGNIISAAFETLFDSFRVLDSSELLEEDKTADTPEEALELLKGGNEEYLKGESGKAVSQELREELYENGQHPYAVVVTCSDSRVPAELIFNCSAGEIFVIRTAGNVIGDLELGSIEYGVEHCKAPLVVVLGHTNCGAVTASASGEVQEGTIAAIVKEIEPAIEKAKEETDDEEEIISIGVENNVSNSIDKIRTSDTINELEEEGKVVVVGAIYDIESGKINWK